MSTSEIAEPQSRLAAMDEENVTLRSVVRSEA